MAPCDPSSDLSPSKASLSDLISIHARLAALLVSEDSPLNKASLSTLTSRTLGLPEEVFVHILSYITSKHDLCQLCLVNHRFLAVAVTFLYSNIHVTFKDVLDSPLIQMLAPEHAGLQFVKQITVSVDKSTRSKPQTIHQWLYLLIHRLVKHQLTDFRWEVPHPLPLHILKVLWQRQRNLRRVEVVAPFVRDKSSDEQLDDTDLWTGLSKIEFTNLTELRVVPDSTELVIVASTALHRDTVTCLEVDGRLWQEADPQIADDFTQNIDNDDEETLKVKDKLTQFLFCHIKPVKPGRIAQCANFTDLRLKDTDLTLCKHTWFTYLELSQLKHLRIEHCAGADIFLMNVTAGAATPGLHSFALIHDLGTSADRTIYAIEELLIYPRNKVKHLELCLRNASELPSAACIRAHGRTLKTLLLDIRIDEPGRSEGPNGWAHAEPPLRSEDTEALTYDILEFQSVVESCSSLVELGIVIPPIDLEYSSITDWKNEFSKWIHEVTKASKKVTTLNVLNWPTGYLSGLSEGRRKARDVQLGRLAADIFQHHRSWNQKKAHANLEVVAFGVREEHTKSSPSPVYFVKSEVDVLGKKPILSAQEVDLKYLKSQDYDTKILDYEARDFDEITRKSLGATHAPGAHW